jgi:hypothetical protein
MGAGYTADAKRPLRTIPRGSGPSFIPNGWTRRGPSGSDLRLYAPGGPSFRQTSARCGVEHLAPKIRLPCS